MASSSDIVFYSLCTPFLQCSQYGKADSDISRNCQAGLYGFCILFIYKRNDVSGIGCNCQLRIYEKTCIVSVTCFIRFQYDHNSVKCKCNCKLLNNLEEIPPGSFYFFNHLFCILIFRFKAENNLIIFNGFIFISRDKICFAETVIAVCSFRKKTGI